MQDDLDRCGTINLRKAAKRYDYFKAVWVNTRSKKNHKYRIVRRVSKYVYVRWDALGAYPPGGLSVKYTVDEFLKSFKLEEA